MAKHACNLCGEQLETKHKLEKHKHDKHVTRVTIGETTVMRTCDGYPCPGCKRILSNPKTLSTHLKKHRLACTPIFNDVASPVPATPSSDESSATTTSSPTSCSSPTIEISIDNDGESWIFNEHDISTLFYEFQVATRDKAVCGHLTIEAHVQHILSLSNILLLKPGRTHQDLHEFIDLATCEELRSDVLTKARIFEYKFPAPLKVELEESVEKLLRPDNLKSSRLAVAKDITSMMQGDAFTKENRILLAIRSMVETLPMYISVDGPQETELITRHLHPLLGRLFEDIDSSTVLRWTSVSDDAKETSVRPDASVNILRGATIGEQLGVGEIKPQYQVLNHRAVQTDLIRIAHLAKNASDHNARQVIFAFLVVGNHMTCYMLQRATRCIYMFVEIAHLQLAYTINDIPTLLGQMTKIGYIVSAFDYAVTLNTRHAYSTHPTTLTDHELLCIVDHRASKKRKSISSHYSH